MKKAPLVLALLVVLIGGGVFLFLKQEGRSDGAALVPADTVAFMSLPDVLRTSNRWPKTSLAQIGADPQVAAFLEKPLQVFQNGGAREATELLQRLKPGRFFLAVPVATREAATVLLGFQFFGTREDLAAAMDRFHAELAKLDPDGQKTVSDFQGDAVTAFGDDSGSIYSAAHGNWALITNERSTLEAALDRAAGRTKDGSLLDSALYKESVARVAENPDFQWFVQPQSFVDLLTQVGDEAGAQVSEAQLAQLRKVQSITGSLLLDGANQRETVFVRYDDPPDPGTLDHSFMRLTSPETVVYFESLQDVSLLASEEYAATLPPEINTFLAQNNITLAELPDIVGQESALIIDWPSSAMIPGVIAMLKIKDRARVEKLVDAILPTVAPQTTASEINGARVIGFPELRIQLIDPALAIGDEAIFLSLATPTLEKALGATTGIEPLEKSPAFEPALAAWGEPGQSFAYIDVRTIFERLYNQMRPVIIFSAAMMPNIANTVDISKLPETEAISKHLGPIVFTQRRLDDGWMLESTGPITLYETFGIIGIGFGGAAAVQAFTGGQ